MADTASRKILSRAGVTGKHGGGEAALTQRFIGSVQHDRVPNVVDEDPGNDGTDENGAKQYGGQTPPVVAAVGVGDGRYDQIRKNERHDDPEGYA